MLHEAVLDPEQQHLVEVEPASVALAARPVQRSRAVVGGEDVDERGGIRPVRLLRQPAEELKISSRPVNVPAIEPLPGTVQVASSAKTSRSAKPRFCANASKIPRTRASFSARATARLPAVDQPFDVPALRIPEVVAPGAAAGPRPGRRSRPQPRGAHAPASAGAIAGATSGGGLPSPGRPAAPSGLGYGGHAARDRQPSRRAAHAARASGARARAPVARRRPALGIVAELPALDVRRPDRAIADRGARRRGLRAGERPRRRARRGDPRARQGPGAVRRRPRRAEHAPCRLGRGIASCPNGISDVELARRVLGAAGDETPVIVLSFGNPEQPRDVGRHTAAEWSARANRRPIEEVVRWLP